MEISVKKIIGGAFLGSVFGFGSPIPGVSAGTLAVLFNVYDKFFNNISWAAFKKNFITIIAFLLGWAAGLLGISRLMIHLFENHGQIISFAFIGLIAGCLPGIYKKAVDKDGKPEVKNVVLFIVAFGAMVFLAVFGGDLAANSTIEQMGVTVGTLAWVFFASFFSSMSMLIPGVGGSLMMIAMGIYTVYLEAVATIHLLLLVVFLVSMVLGVLSGILLTKKLLQNYAKSLYAAISGFILGSVFIIFPGFSLDVSMVISVVMACLCFVGAYWLSGKG